jgi:hypothetical protein
MPFSLPDLRKSVTTMGAGFRYLIAAARCQDEIDFAFSQDDFILYYFQGTAG